MSGMEIVELDAVLLANGAEVARLSTRVVVGGDDWEMLDECRTPTLDLQAPIEVAWVYCTPDTSHALIAPQPIDLSAMRLYPGERFDLTFVIGPGLIPIVGTKHPDWRESWA